MNLKRIARHLLSTDRQVKHAFPRQTLLAIEQAIKTGEAAHVGEIRFVIEAALDVHPLFRGQTARERAIDVFSHLRVWDTEHNNGLLIYLLFADRAVEIVADRGIHAKVGAHEWQSICGTMQAAFRQANYQGGVLGGIQAVAQQLDNHFPVGGAGRNELPDQPLLM
jgi:uncharacterized membrane protein